MGRVESILDGVGQGAGQTLDKSLVCLHKETDIYSHSHLSHIYLK